MATNIMTVTYIWNLFSIKRYWLHILVKFGISIANIERMKVLQIWDILEIKANLNNTLTAISQLEFWLYVSMSVMSRHMHTYTQSKALRDVPGPLRSKCVRWQKWLLWG